MRLLLSLMLAIFLSLTLTNGLRAEETEEQMDIKQLKVLAAGMQDYVVEIRRDLHQNPELRFQEEKTLFLITECVMACDAAKSSDVKVKFARMNGGLVVDFTFNYYFDRVIFRADVDAVPVPEETGLPYASQNPGVSHACGHDTHAAMLLGAMKVIAEGKVRPKHNIRFVFQRAEENPSNVAPISGGAVLVEEGVCDDVSAAYALHIWAPGKAGVFETRPGGFLANSGRMKVVVKTTGGHVAHPEKGSSATDILVDVCNSLKGFPVRHLGGLEQIVLVPASFNSGELGASNVRPAQGEVWFAVRHFLTPEKSAAFQQALTERVRAIVAMHPEAEVEVTHVNGHPALINTPGKFDFISQLLIAAGEETKTSDPIFGGEDFAHYLNKVPGGIWCLGANQEGCGDHHTPKFNPDESVFWKGVLFWLLLATN